jgi:hypothetical protein
MKDNSCYININNKFKQINVINITSPPSSYLDYIALDSFSRTIVVFFMAFQSQTF